MSLDVGGGWELGVAGSQPMSTAVHRSSNILWRSNSIFKKHQPNVFKLANMAVVSELEY